MKNKWAAYLAALLVTAATVASTVFMTPALLRRQENRIISRVNFRNSGDNKSRPYPQLTAIPTEASATPGPAAPTAESTVPRDAATMTLIKKILLMESNTFDRSQTSGPAADESGMKEAVKNCIDQMMILTRAGAMLPMANFPSDYNMNASLQTVVDRDGNSVFDYWSISFSTNPKLTKAGGSIGLMVDAATGKIFSFKMSAKNNKKKIDLTQAATFVANDLGIDGIVKLLPAKYDSAQTAMWISKNNLIYIVFNLTEDSGYSSLTMTITSKPPTR
jgi:hypothetical protein